MDRIPQHFSGWSRSGDAGVSASAELLTLVSVLTLLQQGISDCVQSLVIPAQARTARKSLLQKGLEEDC